MGLTYSMVIVIIRQPNDKMRLLSSLTIAISVIIASALGIYRSVSVHPTKTQTTAIPSAKDTPTPTPTPLNIKRLISERSEALTPQTQERLKSNTYEIYSSGKYEQAYRQEFIDKAMIFTTMPVDEYDAIPMATKMAAKIHELEKHDLTPIVIVEPDSSWGLLSFKELANGLYTKGISRYFEILKLRGVEEEALGLWIPFPEPNVPHWNTQDSTPEDYALAVNLYVSAMKSVYPSAKAGILLNSMSYKPNDTNWNNGRFVSFMPYLQKLDANQIDFFGIQGFPWLPRAKQRNVSAITDAQTFLAVKFVEEAMDYLETNYLFVNTGVFKSKYVNVAKDKITLKVKERDSIMQSITSQILKFKEKYDTVLVNYFAEDKSQKAEATDWSFLPNQNNGYDDQFVLFESVYKLTEGGVEVTIFGL